MVFKWSPVHPSIVVQVSLVSHLSPSAIDSQCNYGEERIDNPNFEVFFAAARKRKGMDGCIIRCTRCWGLRAHLKDSLCSSKKLTKEWLKESRVTRMFKRHSSRCIVEVANSASKYLALVCQDIHLWWETLSGCSGVKRRAHIEKLSIARGFCKGAGPSFAGYKAA